MKTLLKPLNQQLQDQRFDGNILLSFLIEKLTFLFKIPTGRRYSPSLLAMASLWQRI